MKIASTAELSDKGVITYIQAENNNKTGQGEISNQIIKKDWNIIGSRNQW